MTDAFTHDPRITTRTTAGALAGPETAAEHVRNAIMMLETLPAHTFDLPFSEHERMRTWQAEVTAQIQAVRARLARALAALEGSGS